MIGACKAATAIGASNSGASLLAMKIKEAEEGGGVAAEATSASGESKASTSTAYDRPSTVTFNVFMKISSIVFHSMA